MKSIDPTTWRRLILALAAYVTADFLVGAALIGLDGGGVVVPRPLVIALEEIVPILSAIGAALWAGTDGRGRKLAEWLERVYPWAPMVGAAGLAGLAITTGPALLWVGVGACLVLTVLLLRTRPTRAGTRD